MDVTLDELAITSMRGATRDRHIALESALALFPVLSHARYLRALRGFELFLSAWEPRIEAALPTALRDDFASRSRLGLLRKDLALLDADRVMPGDLGKACSQAVAAIDLTSAAATFGAMYVLEGSALGGRIVAAAASASLGLDVDNGAAYFHGLDRHTAARWASFRALLEEHVGSEPLSRAQACASACQTFDALTCVFSTRLPS